MASVIDKRCDNYDNDNVMSRRRGRGSSRLCSSSRAFVNASQSQLKSRGVESRVAAGANAASLAPQPLDIICWRRRPQINVHSSKSNSCSDIQRFIEPVDVTHTNSKHLQMQE